MRHGSGGSSSNRKWNYAYGTIFHSLMWADGVVKGLVFPEEMLEMALPENPSRTAQIRETEPLRRDPNFELLSVTTIQDSESRKALSTS